MIDKVSLKIKELHLDVEKATKSIVFNLEQKITAQIKQQDNELGDGVMVKTEKSLENNAN